MRNELDEKFQPLFVGRRNNGIRALDSFSVVVHAERCILPRFETEWAARIHANEPQIFTQILSFQNLCNVVFIIRNNALRFRHHSSFTMRFDKESTRNAKQAKLPASLVGKRDDGVITGSAKRRINRACGCTCNCKENGTDKPLPRNLNLQRWNRLFKDGFSQKCKSNSCKTADDGESERFAK